MNFKLRKIVLLLIDMMLSAISCLLILKFFSISGSYNTDFAVKHTAVTIVSLTVARILFGIYSKTWRFASMSNLLALFISDACGCIVSAAIIFFADGQQAMPFVYMMCACSLSLLMMLAARVVYVIYSNHVRQKIAHKDENEVRCAIVGAGYGGATLLQEMRLGAVSNYAPCCFFDVDKNKIGGNVNGLRIYDMNADIPKVVNDLEIKELIIAIPSATPDEKKHIVELCTETGCVIKIYDFDIGGQKVKGGNVKLKLRDVDVSELLGREQVHLSLDSVRTMIQDKVVMVTGGGGSIGSELCRQIAALSPKLLIILDIYENNAYEIQQELIRQHGDRLNMQVLIASVRDKDKIDRIFDEYRPELVFHAAAHKHVPLMESDPDEAVKNNIFGTYNVASAAEKYRTGKMILISTDKAVNPTNCMGATKRACEMVIQSRSGGSTDYAAVRFGNVLGSNGSVIPIFKKQIAAGGPVTVTDKRITRFFMTIPEAVQLVLEAGAMAKNGEIFVLDMGEPVKILHLAESLIKLSGYEPYKDIDIIESGLRPGEKLYEELLMDSDTLTKTDNSKIFVEQAGSFSREHVEEMLAVLRAALATKNNENVKAALKQIVPTFHENTYYNSKVK